MSSNSNTRTTHQSAMTKRVVIVGAGPAGLLLALNLLNRNSGENVKHEIVIIERRSDPRTATAKENQDIRTFPLALQSRGMNALPSEIASRLSDQGTWTTGVCIHTQQGKTRDIPRNNATLSVDRNQLALTLLEAVAAAASTSSMNLSFHFNTSFERLDLENKRLTIGLTSEGEPSTKLSELSFDYLIAADGAKSKIRAALVEENKLECQQRPIPDEYRTIHFLRESPPAAVAVSTGFDSGEESESDSSSTTIPKEESKQTIAGPSGALADEKIHAWMLASNKVIACPIHPGIVSGVIIFNKGEDPFQNMASPQEVLDFFEDLSPDELRPLLTEEEASALLKRPTSGLLSVRCNQLHVGDSILLLGDAAHAVSASAGQGCNSALQDVEIFCDLLDQYGGNWDRAIPAYSATRLADAHAVVEISEFVMPRAGFMKAEFIFRSVVRKLLPESLRDWVLNPLPMELLNETSLSYTEVLEKTKWWIDRVKAQQQQHVC